jgi:hypothetical protein
MRGSLVAAVSFCALVSWSASAAADGVGNPELKPVVTSVDEATFPTPSARWKVVALGLGTSAAAYGAAAGMSYGYPDAPGARDLRAPFVGPWLAIAHNGCSDDEPDCSKAFVVLRSLITAIDGIAQAGGIFVALEGLFMTTQLPASRPLTPAPAPSEPGPPANENDKGKNLFFLPTPMTMGARGVGLGVVGRF